MGKFYQVARRNAIVAEAQDLKSRKTAWLKLYLVYVIILNI